MVSKEHNKNGERLNPNQEYMANTTTNDSAFYPDEKMNVDKLLQQKVDPTNYSSTSNSRSHYVILGLAVIGVGVIIGLAVLVINVLASQKANNPNPDSAVSTEAVTETSPTPVTPPKNPLSASLPTPIKTITGKIDSQATDTIFKAGDMTLTVRGAKITGAVTSCSVVDPTDFCLAGNATLGEKTAQVYLMKDAANSRLFENPSNFQQLTVPGAVTAASMNVALIGNTPTPIIVVVASNGSGYMLTLPDTDAVETFANALSLA